MIENKSNILKTFQGQKIDESVHVARWATTVNNEDSSKNIFMKYAGGSSNNTIPQNTSDIMRNQNGYQTQLSQVHEIDTGFKKLKNNQIQMLKQLKQQYEVLRTLNMQNQVPKQNIINSQSSSSLRQINSHDSQIISTSSHHSKKKKSHVNNREVQILILQKKQLQMVINNSMKKIQELLHSEMEYKKHIHQLKIQATGRQNTDIQYQLMLKTLKKNQINTNETIQSLKKQHDKLRIQNKQLNDKNINLQNQITTKDQQVRKIYEDKRKTQDLIRLEKDRYFNLDIDCKKIKMEFQLMEKDKNSQINRLNKQMSFKDTNRIKQLQYQLKRYQEDIEIKDKRYNLLLTQLEDVKKKNIQIQTEFQHFRSSQQAHILDKEHIEQLLTNFRDQNDSSSFNKNINEVLNRLNEVEKYQNMQLKEQIEELKDEIISLKDINNPQSNINFELYQRKIHELQENLRIQINDKEMLISEMRKIKIQNEDLTRKNNNYQTQIHQFESYQNKVRQQQRTRKASVRMQDSIMKTNQIFTNKKINDLEQQLKIQKRRADESEFKVSKANNELNYKLKMQQNQHNLILSRQIEDLERLRRDYHILKQEYEKYQIISEGKLNEREKQFESLRLQLRNNNDYGQNNISNIKLEYEALIKNQRERYRVQVDKLTDQITLLTKINQKYMLETNKYLHFENQLINLKQILRKNIHLSESVDHLWRIKQTEYQNLNEVLRRISSTWQY